MKTIMLTIVICLLMFCGNAFTQTDISGTWEGKLDISPNQKLTIRFIISKQDDGSYKAVLDSPETGAIKNEPASSVVYAGGKLTVEVDGLSGSYSGTVSEGTITGEWKQPGSALPLILTAYKKPSASTFKPLLGEWHGKLIVPGGDPLTTVFQFKMSEDGQISASLQIVEQGQQNVPVNNILFKDNQLSFNVAGQVNYEGRLSGDTITGIAKQGGIDLELNLARGKYADPGIDMPAEDIKRLEGQWVGKIKMQDEMVMTVVIRFERTQSGKLKAAAASPEQGAGEIPITEVVLKGDQLSFRIPRTNGTFTGKLDNNSMTGNYNTGAVNTEITVIRGAKIVPEVAQIDIPDETMKKLLGRWSGNIGAVQMVFRFERNAGGKNVIYIDVPQQGTENIPVLKASLTEGKLSLKIPGAEYSGSLGDNKIDGTFNQSGQIIPLVLTKE